MGGASAGNSVDAVTDFLAADKLGRVDQPVRKHLPVHSKTCISDRPRPTAGATRGPQPLYLSDNVRYTYKQSFAFRNLGQYRETLKK
jgi:hypothetical protein